LKVLAAPLPKALKNAQARSLAARLQPKFTAEEWARFNRELEELSH
jgi:hypothetical protein